MITFFKMLLMAPIFGVVAFLISLPWLLPVVALSVLFYTEPGLFEAIGQKVSAILHGTVAMVWVFFSQRLSFRVTSVAMPIDGLGGYFAAFMDWARFFMAAFMLTIVAFGIWAIFASGLAPEAADPNGNPFFRTTYLEPYDVIHSGRWVILLEVGALAILGTIVGVFASGFLRRSAMRPEWLGVFLGTARVVVLSVPFALIVLQMKEIGFFAFAMVRDAFEIDPQLPLAWQVWAAMAGLYWCVVSSAIGLAARDRLVGFYANAVGRAMDERRQEGETADERRTTVRRTLDERMR